MILLNLLFLIPLSLIGGISVFTDIKYGIIKNKLILIGLIWALLLYAGLVLYAIFYLDQDREAINYVLEMVLNSLLAFGVGYSLWRAGLWAAGDTKLFTLYAFLIPLNFYSTNYFNYFPSLVLLINTFFPVVLFLLGEFLFFLFRKSIFAINQAFLSKKMVINWKNLLKSIRLEQKIASSVKVYLNYVAIFFILRVLIQVWNYLFAREISANYALAFVISFAFRKYFINRLVKNKLTVIILLFLTSGYTIYLIVNNQVDNLINTLATSFIFMIAIGLLMKILNLYIEKKEIKKIKIGQLKNNMVIVKDDIKEITKRINKKNLEENLYFNYSDALTTEQIGFLERVFAGEPETEIRVYKTFAFAPFMFLAYIITLLLKGSIISFTLTFFAN